MCGRSPRLTDSRWVRIGSRPRSLADRVGAIVVVIAVESEQSWQRMDWIVYRSWDRAAPERIARLAGRGNTDAS